MKKSPIKGVKYSTRRSSHGNGNPKKKKVVCKRKSRGAIQQCDKGYGKEDEILLLKDVAKIKRSGAICCRGYYYWRRQLWDNINMFLKKRNISGLNTLYGLQFERWMELNKIDLAFITLCRQGLSVLFNVGIKEALQLMKLAQKRLLEAPEFENKVFVAAGMYSILGMLYVDKGKPGKGRVWMEKAQYHLVGTESSEFTAELNYVLGKYYLHLSSVMKSSRKELLEKAVTCAETSREICINEWKNGEWYALYAVESLFLVLRVRLDAESFPDDSMTFRDICKGEAWPEKDLIELQKLTRKVEGECSLLKYEYIYVKMGLAKCRCILGIRWMQLYGQAGLFEHAMGSCKKSKKIAAECNAQLSGYLNKTKGCVMSKYVHKTQNKFQRISEILEHCYLALKAKISVKTGKDCVSLKSNSVDEPKMEDIASCDSSEESKDIIEVVKSLSNLGPLTQSASSEQN